MQDPALAIDQAPDPVTEFFEGARRQLSPPQQPAAMASVIDKVVAAKLDKPLTFTMEDNGASGDSLDMGPALSLARHTPVATAMHVVQLRAVTRKVTKLQIGEHSGGSVPQPFFTTVPLLVLSNPPARDKTPRKTRAPMAPLRQSTRQASNPSPVPVMERATLRLMHGLGILGPKENMTTSAMKALIRRFDEPLSEEDIAAIARLTRLDANALNVAAGMLGADGEASRPLVYPC